MSKLLPLTGKLLEEQVTRLNGLAKPKWSIQIADNQSSLLANYQFKTFAKTWKFLNSVAIPSHKLRHHPTITTTYNKVEIKLTTHDVGNQITMMDLRLAQEISETYMELESNQNQVYNGNIKENAEGKEISLSEATRIVNEIIRS